VTDRQTDGQTDRQIHVSCHGIARAMHTRRAVKTTAAPAVVMRPSEEIGQSLWDDVIKYARWQHPAMSRSRRLDIIICRLMLNILQNIRKLLNVKLKY